MTGYDAGLLNDYGGGDVDWWQDYLRAEIGRANDHWADYCADLEARLAASERRARVLDDAVYRMCLRIAAEHGMNSAQMLKVRDDAIAESEEGSDE